MKKNFEIGYLIFFLFLFLTAAKSGAGEFAERAAEDPEKARTAIRQTWLETLGRPSHGDFESEVETVERFTTPEFEAELLFQKTGPATRQKMLLLRR